MNKLKSLILLSIFIILTSTLPVSAQDSATSSGTEDSNSIREKVQQKIEEAKNKRKAYLGSITDIVEETIQSKSPSGEIQQISATSDSTVFVKVGKTNQTIKFEDVAIGDFIIAMGLVNGEGVLTAQRVLITTEPEAPSRQTLKGNIVGIESKTLTLSTNDGEFELLFPKRWKGPEISELEDGFEVITVAEDDEGDLTIRTIQIIDGGSPISEE